LLSASSRYGRGKGRGGQARVRPAGARPEPARRKAPAVDG